MLGKVNNLMDEKSSNEFVDKLFDKAEVNGILYFRNWITAAMGAGVQKMLMLSKPFVERLTDKVELDPLSKQIPRHLVFRCVARKSYESMEALMVLVKDGYSYAAMSILRSMCEDLIFSKFISSLSSSDAEAFLSATSHLEFAESSEAQRKYFRKRSKSSDSKETTESIEASHYLSDLKSQQSIILKDMGKRLGWGNKAKPTVKYMAETVDLLDVYEFYYYATSASVHTSLHLLLRMVWGDVAAGKYSITNNNFEAFYRRVVLVYGAILYDNVLMVISSQFPDMWPEEQREYRKSTEYSISYPPPIISEEEMRVPGASQRSTS